MRVLRQLRCRLQTARHHQRADVTWKPKGVLKGHTDCVCAVSFSDWGAWLATASFDGTSKLWDLDKRRAAKTITGHKGPVLTVFAAGLQLNEPWVITGGVDGSIRGAGGGEIGLLRRHKSWVNAVTRSNDGTWASGSSDGTVQATGTRLPVILEGGAGEVRCVAFNPNGKLLAAGNRYGTVRIWDVASKKELKTLTGHMGEVWSIAFSPDGKTLAAVDTEWKKPSQVKLYDTTTWKERGALACPGEILSIAYSPKGDWLAAGCWDKTVRLFALAGK
jgi:WD40 repeat protein